MSVLELSEESRSLRQASKAWANGDIPTADYRMIRRATLEGMLGTIEPDDDTQTPDNVTEPNDDTEVIDPADLPPRSVPRNSMLLLAAALIIAGGVLVLFLN